MPKTLTQDDLDHFTGSVHWYRHALVRGVMFTDGAEHVADAGGAYWLLDEIALAQRFEKAVAIEEVQVWKLKVNADHTANLTYEDGNDNDVSNKALAFIDFPLAATTLWFANNTIYLPSEH